MCHWMLMIQMHENNFWKSVYAYTSFEHVVWVSTRSEMFTNQYGNKQMAQNYGRGLKLWYLERCAGAIVYLPFTL